MHIVEPELVGLCSSRLARVTAALRRWVETGVLPGVAALISRRGQVCYAEALGQRDIAADLPMTLDTIVRIYSMTKPITSAALMMLYEEGAFNLYDPVSRFIPAFKGIQVYSECGGVGHLAPAEREITVRDLLTHTAGLIYGGRDGAVDRLYQQAGIWDVNPEPTLAEWVARLAKLPLAFQPGARWQYSCAIDVLGYLIEVLSDRPFDVFLCERLFDPLGMSDTDFYAPPASQPRFAKLYSPNAGGFVETDSLLGVRYDQPHPRMLGGAGLVSTISDYWRFAQLLLTGEFAGQRFLGRKTLELMRANHLPASLLPFSESPTTFHGYGFGLGGAVLLDIAAAQTPGSVGCFGWSGAASTDFWVDPVEDLTALFITQVMPQPFGPINHEFRRLVYQALVE